MVEIVVSRAFVVLPLLLVLAGPARAHHSLAHYDYVRQVALEGTVSAFQFANPHPILFITVKSDAGAAQTWRLEMDNLFELADIGLSRDSFRPGERVVVSGSPDRNQPRSLYLRRLDRPADGLHYEQVGSSPSVERRPAK